MTESPIYEVRCPRCETSFAPETRRCVHCGGGLHKGSATASMAQAPPPAEPSSGELPDDPDEASGELALGGRGRGLLWLLTGVLALAGSLARNCQAG